MWRLCGDYAKEGGEERGEGRGKREEGRRERGERREERGERRRKKGERREERGEREIFRLHSLKITFLSVNQATSSPTGLLCETNFCNVLHHWFRLHSLKITFLSINQATSSPTELLCGNCFQKFVPPELDRRDSFLYAFHVGNRSRFFLLCSVEARCFADSNRRSRQYGAPNYRNTRKAYKQIEKHRKPRKTKEQKKQENQQNN